MSRFASAVVFLVGVAAAAAAYLWWQARDETQPPLPPRPPFVIPATLAKVERGTLAAHAALTGTVRPVQRARIGFAIGGSLASVAVREGDVVAADAPLAALDDRDQRARLALSEADTTLARTELALVEAPTRPEEVRRLEGLVRTAEADVSWAAAEVERMRPLAAERIVAPNALGEMVARRDAAQGRLEAAREAAAIAKAGAREEDLAVLRARVAAREAAEGLARRELDKTKLIAPFAGQVLRRLAAAGDAVNAGQAVLELVELSRREIEVEIPARHAPRVGHRPKVVLTVDEHPEFALEAVLDAQAQAADERTGALRGFVRLVAGVAADVLLPGTFVRVRVALEPLSDVLLVPTDAVRHVERGPIVVKAVPPATPPPGAPAPAPGAPARSAPWSAEFVPVRLLGADGGRTAVALAPPGPPPAAAATGAPPAAPPTLEAGDHVLVVSVDRAFPGALILPRERVAPPGVGTGSATHGSTPSAAAPSAGGSGGGTAPIPGAADAADGAPKPRTP